MAASSGHIVPVFYMSSGQTAHPYLLPYSCFGCFTLLWHRWFIFRGESSIYSFQKHNPGVFFFQKTEANIEPDIACSTLLGLFDEQERQDQMLSGTDWFYQEGQGAWTIIHVQGRVNMELICVDRSLDWSPGTGSFHV